MRIISFSCPWSVKENMNSLFNSLRITWNYLSWGSVLRVGSLIKSGHHSSYITWHDAEDCYFYRKRCLSIAGYPDAIRRSVSQSECWSFNLSADHSVIYPVSRCVGHSVCRLVSQSFTKSVSESVCRSFSLSAGQSVIYTVSQSVCKSSSQSGGQFVSRAVSLF